MSMTKITHDFFRTKCKRTIKGLSLFVLFLMGTQVSWGQQPIGTGQFDGGFENATLNATALTQTTADATKWSYDSSGLSTSNVSTTDKRSGAKSFNYVSVNVNTGKYLMSPKCSPALVGGDGTTAGPAYVIQYYVKSLASPIPTKGAVNLSNRFSGAGTQAAADTNGWQKVTYRYVNATAVAQATGTWAGVGTNLTSVGTSWTAYIDDFVVYLGAADDNTVPDAPTGPAVSGMNVSWTAPGAGVDGGGYMVVRYATNPNADNDPNVNGIYAKGNTITNGTGALVGTVVFVGTATSFTDDVAGSVSGSDYYKIYTVDKAFNYSNEIIAAPVALPTSTTWTTSWSNGSPTASLEAIIDGTYNTNVGGEQGPFTAKKLTVNANKSLTINSGTNVTVQNEVINNGSLVVENNANLIQVNNVANTGNIVVNRNSNPLLLYDYTLWSSPVASQNLAAFSPLTSLSPNRFYIYDSASDKYTNTIPVTLDPTTTNFVPGAGYLIRMPNTADAVIPTAYPGVFTGVPNNGDVPFTLSIAGGGYNLVGNPYPSTINLFTLQANNSTVIGNTFYMWRKTNGVGTAYCSYVPTSAIAGTYVTNSNAQSPASFVGNIQAGQGFFVSALTTGPLVFKNGQRATTASSFFKTKNAVLDGKLWLNATNAAGDFSQMAVTYFDGANQGVDIYDGKYINDSKFALTSKINNEEYVIQGRPAFDASDVVALNFKTDVAGDYTIAIDHTDGLFATDQDIYLVDSKTGTETNLKTTAYTFTAASGVDTTRFSLKYQKTLKVDTSVANDDSIAVYKNNGVIYVKSDASAISNIKVYDIQGRVIAEQNNVKANTAAIHNLKATQQVLIVKVTSEDNKVVSKKVEN